MEITKIAVITYVETDWLSCRTIKSNLLKSYQNLGDCYEIITVEINNSWENDFCDMYIRLKEINPDTIVILDHNPVPYKLFLYLSLDKSFDSKNYVFHLYGDFMFYFWSWYGTLNLLSGKKVKLFCASDAQRDLVSGLVQDGSQVSTVPFPIERAKFFFSQKIRTEMRKKLKIKSDEFCLLYTGRISSQKNIVKLLDSVNYIKQNLGINLKIYLAGTFDDLGVPYLKHQYLKMHHLGQCLEKINENDSIVYLGSLKYDELNKYYNACDIYCSLSVHNDEDYGMAPAEALATGMQVILSSWGGFKSFKRINVELVSVNITEKSIDVSSTDFVKKVFKVISKSLDSNVREQFSLEFIESYSVENISKLLVSKLGSDFLSFAGFTMAASELVDKSKNDQLFNSVVKAYSQDYLNIYKGTYD